MCYGLFTDIDRLHSEWSKMNKVAKIGFLTDEKIKLNKAASKLTFLINAKGSIMNGAERIYALKLLGMMESRNSESTIDINDFLNNVLGD